MSFHRLPLRAALLSLVLATVVGCEEKTVALAADQTPPADAKKDGAPGKEAAKSPKAEANYIVGRVTMGDGTPLTGDIKDIAISIEGVSEAGGRVSYAPAVKPDGTYRQKAVPGQYTFGRSQLVVVYNKIEIKIPLEPVGRTWDKSQDVADGIVQEFVWKVTGPTPFGQSEGLDPTNATHWYGMSVGLRADGWRQDVNKAPTKIPDGTTLTFTLKPTGKAIDGSDLKPITMERTYKAADRTNQDLNDVPPAPYVLSGVAKLPDGTVKPVLLQTLSEYPGHKPTVTIAVEIDKILGRIAKTPCTFIVE